jgi:hypothetical protein
MSMLSICIRTDALLSPSRARYADAKNKSQIGYCLDLYALDDRIRRRGRQNLILLVWAAARHFGGWSPAPRVSANASESSMASVQQQQQMYDGWAVATVRDIRAAANVLRLPRDGWKAATDSVDRLEEEITAILAEGVLSQGEAKLVEEAAKESEEAQSWEQLKEVEVRLQGLKRKARDVAALNFKLWADARRVKVGWHVCGSGVDLLLCWSKDSSTAAFCHRCYPSCNASFSRFFGYPFVLQWLSSHCTYCCYCNFKSSPRINGD